MEREIQSHLLRLSILLATSLTALSEPVTPVIDKDASSANALSKQILGDVQILITAVQKSCTNLTLALRPSVNVNEAAAKRSSAVAVSPTAGLDDESLIAAKAQIMSIMNESVPKLVFLARKATSEALVYRYVAKTAEEIAREQAERDFIRSKGGHVVRPAHARDTERLQKIKGRGLGKAWSKSLVATVFGLLEALGELSRSYMDDRTLTVLQKASQARNKFDGGVTFDALEASNSKSAPADMSNDANQARQRALHATGVVWSVCDAALKGKQRLTSDNQAAVRDSWRMRTDVLKDAMRELAEALEEDRETQQRMDSEVDDNDDDLFGGLGDSPLDDAQRKAASQHAQLVKACCELHARVGEAFFDSSDTSFTTEHPDTDLDDLDEAGEAVSEAIDSMIAALLYGVDDDDDVGAGRLVKTIAALYTEAMTDATPEHQILIAEKWDKVQAESRNVGLKEV